MRAALLLLPFLLAACDAPVATPPDSEAATLPLLPAGLTVGTTLYGSADLGALSSGERATLDAAIARGLGGFSFYVDWADLEAQEGVYTLDAFIATLDALQALGLTPLVNLTVGDSGGYNLPPGLGNGAGGVASGVRLDDEAVLERFGRLLDRIAPALVARGGFFLAVGNEMGEYLDADREAREAYTAFVEAARQRVHAREPQLAVGVTLTTGAVRQRTATYRAMRGVADAVAINYGPIQDDFFVIPEADIRADVREVIEASGDGPLIIQELTCPNPTSMGASDAWQETCFEILMDEVLATPRVRFASVFTFLDFDAPTCQAVQDALLGDELDDLPPEVAQRLGDYFCGLGVVREGGQPRPGWEVVLDGIEG
ncbi:MAG: hypothetical protein AAFQ43_05380 [Bacteroidota bacterium]